MFVMQAVYEGVKELPASGNWPASALIQLADAELFERFSLVADAEIGTELRDMSVGSTVRVEVAVRRANVDAAGAFYKLRAVRLLGTDDGGKKTAP